MIEADRADTGNESIPIQGKNNSIRFSIFYSLISPLSRFLAEINTHES